MFSSTARTPNTASSHSSPTNSVTIKSHHKEVDFSVWLWLLGKGEKRVMRIPTMPRMVALALAGFATANPARAAFHVMQIEQVIGGVINGASADTSAQAIQLRMRAAGQNFVSAARLI